MSVLGLWATAHHIYLVAPSNWWLVGTQTIECREQKMTKGCAGGQRVKKISALSGSLSRAPPTAPTDSQRQPLKSVRGEWEVVFESLEIKGKSIMR